MALLISGDDRKPARLARTGTSQLAAAHCTRLSAGPLGTSGTNPSRLLVRGPFRGAKAETALQRGTDRNAPS